MALASSNSKPLPPYLQLDHIPDEHRELLRSLPSEKGWLSPWVHRYEGFWYSTHYISGVLWAQRQFKALDSDVFLVTTPKSGTTWLKALLFALLNRSRYPDQPDTMAPNDTAIHPLLQRNPQELVPFLEVQLYVKDPNPDLSGFTSPRLFATHIPIGTLPESIRDSDCKLVYLCRNPKDTFVSIWHFMNKLKPEGTIANSLEESLDMFCQGISTFGPYWDHVLGYYKASLEMPHKVMFLKYEDMKEQPREQLKRLASFLGCPFSEDEEVAGTVDRILRLCSFENLSTLDVNRSGKLQSGMDNKVFFRKGQVGDWVNHLSPEMIAKIDRITEEKLHGSGLVL